jgi:TonB-linked SusC/RagA family outer membrane protein
MRNVKTWGILFLCLLLLPGVAYAQKRQIEGTVISQEDKEPLIGATVIVKGSLSGAETDLDGHFTLEVDPDAKFIIVDYIGMKQTQVPIPKSGILNVALQPEAMNLDEVVVTGYGNFSRSSFTGSANTLRADLLKEMPVVSIEQKLQGMTSGVNITGSSGQPGANASIRIRGMGSFNASNEPLFVIDGVPVTSGNLSTGSGSEASYMNNAKTNIMSTINPSDIENITVIKDAAAASLYGSRAANGVILITTKQGSKGRTRVTLNASAGFSDAAVDFRPTLNGEQRRELLYEGLVNYAQDQIAKDPASFTQTPEEYANANIGAYTSVPALGYTDWKDVLMRRAVHQNYEASISGGSENTTVYSSLGYQKQEGLVENSSMERYSGRFNVQQKIGKRGEAGANLMFSQVNQEMNEERTSSINPFYCMAVATPSYPVFNEDGSYANTYPGTNVNPLRDMRTDYNRVRMTRIFGTAHGAVEIIKGLKLKEVLSYDYSIQKDARYFNALSGAGPKSGSDAQSSKGFIEYGKLISSTSLNYVRTFANKHHLDVLAAYEAESFQTDKAAGEKSKMPSDQLFEPDNAAVINSFVSSTQDYRLLSYLTRLNYDYDNRYYIAGSFRRDGSSRLAPEHRWGNFWSVSGMWHLGAEDFMKAVKPVLSDVKIRASYGVNGNQPGSYYGYMGLYSYGKNYMDNPGSYESTQANPNLKWEKNYNMNLGLDLAFIDRIFVTLEYYNRDTKDLLYNRPISATTGFLNYLGNLGQLNNKGVELEVRSLNISNADFNWTTVLNLTHNKNKIVALDGNLDQVVESSWFIRKIGLPFNTFYVKEFAGVDPSSGNALYYKNTEDENGNLDRTLTQDVNEAQAVPYKQVDPKISGGLTNILSYKWFDLAFTLSYSLGGYSFDKTGTYIETDGASEGNRNLPIYELDRWQKPGDITDIPRFVLGRSDKVSGGSSRFVHSTDHLRLKNLTFGFTLPHNWTDKVLLDKVRVYFSGSNLLTWAKWKQYDPEVPVSGEVFCETPPMRTFSFGVEVNF